MGTHRKFCAVTKVAVTAVLIKSFLVKVGYSLQMSTDERKYNPYTPTLVV